MRPAILISLSLCGISYMPAAKAADALRGAQVFQAHCGMCHSDVDHASPNFGPNLFGIVGRKPGADKAFDYSPSIRSLLQVWNTDRLRLFVGAPATTVPGIRMPGEGVRDAKARDDLIAYLETRH